MPYACFFSHSQPERKFCPTETTTTDRRALVLPPLPPPTLLFQPRVFAAAGASVAVHLIEKLSRSSSSSQGRGSCLTGSHGNRVSGCARPHTLLVLSSTTRLASLCPSLLFALSFTFSFREFASLPCACSNSKKATHTRKGIFSPLCRVCMFAPCVRVLVGDVLCAAPYSGDIFCAWQRGQGLCFTPQNKTNNSTRACVRGKHE